MANKQFKVPINLVNLASDPGTASEGDIYYNTTSDVVRVYANGSWASIGSGGGSTSLDGVTDVTITSVADNEVLAYDTTTSQWINQTPAEAGIQAVVANVTDTEIGYLDGVTSAIQTQIDSKQPTFTGYDYEIHVSQVDGNDTTGNGDLLTPVATITKALTLITGNRKTVIVHPGTYTESPSITTQYTTITGPGLIGGNIVVSGTISTNTGCTISGIKMTNLTVTTPTGTGNVNILNCEVSGTFTKTSNADYTVLRLCDLNAASITGAGLVAIFGGNPNFVTVNNASANVIVKSAVTVAPVLTAGTLSLVDSVVGAAVTNAVTSAASSIITLANCQFLTSALTGVAPVVLNGFYSILNCVYDKPNSTLVAASGTGGTTNSIDYFQYINADKFITQGGTSSQFVKGDGSLDTNTYLNTSATSINGTTIPSSKTLVVTTDIGSTVQAYSATLAGINTLGSGTGFLKNTAGTWSYDNSTYATTSGNLSQFAATTSSQLLGVISDETGTGALVFGTSPTFTTSVIGGATFSAFTTTNNLTIGKNTGYTNTIVTNNILSGGNINGTSSSTTVTDNYSSRNIVSNFDEDQLIVNIGTGTVTNNANYATKIINIGTGSLINADSSTQISIGSTGTSTGIYGNVTLSSNTSIGAVTSTEISYLDGVTSAIQTQLGAKSPLASPTFTGTVTIPAGASISGYLTTSSASSTYAALSGATFTGAVSGTSLTLSGDLIINGTTTTINSTTLTVDDKNIELGSVVSPTNTTADGGGITLKGATDKTFNWVNSTSAWTSSEHISLGTGKNLLLNGSTSGTITITPTAISGTNTITLPALTGTVALLSSPTFTGTVTIPTLNLTNALGYAYGGTGLTSIGTAGQVLKVNTGATALEWGTVSSFTDSASLAALLSDETGSGSVVFSNSPTFTGNVTVGEAIVKTTVTSITPSSTTVIAGFPYQDLVGGVVVAECIVLLSSTSDGSYYTSKILVGGGYPAGTPTANLTEYAIIEDGSMDVTFTADLGSLGGGGGGNTHVFLKALVTNSNVTAKVISTSITASNAAT
jgi:hypothetical protein